MRLEEARDRGSMRGKSYSAFSADIPWRFYSHTMVLVIIDTRVIWVRRRYTAWIADHSMSTSISCILQTMLVTRRAGHPKGVETYSESAAHIIWLNGCITTSTRAMTTLLVEYARPGSVHRQLYPWRRSYSIAVVIDCKQRR